MANTYTLIASSTVGSGGAASIDFNSIPSTYTDLLLKISTRDNSSAIGNNIIFKINGVTTSQSIRFLIGDGASASSANDTPLYFTANGNTSTASTFANIEVYLPNYALTTINKSASIDAVSENNATTAYATLGAGLYAANTAISSISMTTNGGVNFLQYSTAYLYGISNS
jgi:hypothetical protein